MTLLSPSERAARLRQALALFDVFGANTGRWPADAQSLAREFAGDPDFEGARADALALAEALDLAPAPRAGEALKARLLDAAPAPGPRAAFSARAIFSPRRFAPAGMLAGLSALGFAAGVASAATGVGADDDALAYAEAAVVAALEEEDAFWAVVE